MGERWSEERSSIDNWQHYHMGNINCTTRRRSDAVKPNAKGCAGFGSMVCSTVASLLKVEFRSDLFSTFVAHLLSVPCAGFVGFQDKARFVFRYAPGADRKSSMPTIR